jgi:carbamoyl-phosphate synthase large subunit
MHSTVMVFGAGINQLTLIEAVRELGYRSLVIDPAEDPPGKAIADIFLSIPRDDFASIKQAAIKYGVSGIVTSQMENPLKIMARLAKELDFVFHSPEVIETSTNKYLMKSAFQSFGVPCAKGIWIERGRILAQEELSEFPYPFIIKPPAAFSSRGVYRIGSYNEYRDKLTRTLAFSNDQSYLIEQFIDGPEFSVETVTYMGTTDVIQFTEKMITPYPETVEIGHTQPASLSLEQRLEMANVVSNAIKALGIDNSAAHVELKLSRSGPVIIEVGPRLGGDFISSYLVKNSTGIDMEKAVVSMAMGLQPDLSPGTYAASAILYLILPSGAKVRAINTPSSDKTHQDVVMSHLSVSPGDYIDKVTDSAKRSGWVITRGANREEALALAKKELAVLRNRLVLQSPDNP